MSWRGYMVGTYGCATKDAAANYRMQNPGSIGLSDRAAAAKMHNSGGCPSTTRRGVDKDASKELQQAAKTGQGVTKAQLQDVVTRAVQRQGSGEKLGAPARLAIGQAVKDNAFARRSTAQLALQLSQGKITPADIGAQIGRAK